MPESKQVNKVDVAQVFSCEYCEIFKNTFFVEHLRWLPLLKLEPSLCNQQNFSSNYFWLHLISWALSTVWQNSCKTRYSQKNICAGVHSYCNSNFKTFKLKKNSLQWYVLSLEVSFYSQSGWCIEIVFWIIWVLRTRLYL